MELLTSLHSTNDAYRLEYCFSDRLLADSRLVVEKDGKFDFALAIFREWFAARALVEKTVSPSDIDLTSDRWVVSLAIAINSENASLGSEIMETISAKDPGIAGLVLEEVKNNWSVEEPPEEPPDGTSIEIGHRIRRAMFNWKLGLGPLLTCDWANVSRWRHSLTGG